MASIVASRSSFTAPSFVDYADNNIIANGSYGKDRDTVLAESFAGIALDAPEVCSSSDSMVSEPETPPCSINSSEKRDYASLECEEPLLRENPDRFSMFPIQ